MAANTANNHSNRTNADDSTTLVNNETGTDAANGNLGAGTELTAEEALINKEQRQALKKLKLKEDIQKLQKLIFKLQSFRTSINDLFENLSKFYLNEDQINQFSEELNQLFAKFQLFKTEIYSHSDLLIEIQNKVASGQIIKLENELKNQPRSKNNELNKETESLFHSSITKIRQSIDKSLQLLTDNNEHHPNKYRLVVDPINFNENITVDNLTSRLDRFRELNKSKFFFQYDLDPDLKDRESETGFFTIYLEYILKIKVYIKCKSPTSPITITNCIFYGIQESLKFNEPSEFGVLRKISELTNKHIPFPSFIDNFEYSDGNRDSLEPFLHWVFSYYTLFSDKCKKCDKHLKFFDAKLGFLPPYHRVYSPQLKKFIPYHSDCTE
ncbi:hypothetical protein CONCODRAFT_71526 [Conidiobolus coronatus NRRL 28638]|uniref:Mediator of RNA polymerase II transcription subunit 27 n=1 Tax=Conidiobolus coronatus (strain ATCC 28846 / CBS 209.66 / NRRL 28638) TaxID=796925 RepID=A0A137P2V6_CONC2|nr:hypothetical protein CONCODRAFT_71526 [Conidiobolus coronatus NRRL 28638]|eukprot:KXN69366.1 hypothetical protein CONCODRAFT_71526 [Conidiobolus coronatus NRRL 28638]